MTTGSRIKDTISMPDNLITDRWVPAVEFPGAPVRQVPSACFFADCIFRVSGHRAINGVSVTLPSAEHNSVINTCIATNKSLDDIMAPDSDESIILSAMC
jgi:hypothetical protein